MGEFDDREQFSKELFDLMSEMFETSYGIVLDRGTLLCKTLETVTASEASRPVG